MSRKRDRSDERRSESESETEDYTTQDSDEFDSEPDAQLRKDELLNIMGLAWRQYCKIAEFADQISEITPKELKFQKHFDELQNKEKYKKIVLCIKKWKGEMKQTTNKLENLIRTMEKTLKNKQIASSSEITGVLSEFHN